MSLRLLFIPIILISASIILVLLIPQITAEFKNKFPPKNYLVFIPPPQGLNTEAKKKLNNLLLKIDYLQPSYIPINFVKSYDFVEPFAVAADSGIMTNYKATNTNFMYSGLGMNQIPISEAQYKNVAEVPSDSRYPAKTLFIKNQPAIYMQQPPQLIDPGYQAGWWDSEERKLLIKGNTNKSLYLFTSKSLIVFTIGYTNSISGPKAESELIRMAQSLQIGKVPEYLTLNTEDIAELTTTSIRNMANILSMAHFGYLLEKKEFPWQTTTNCLGGVAPKEVQLSSREFTGCLDLLKPQFSLSEKVYYNEALLSSLYISYGDVENFYQPNVNSQSLQIFKSKLPKICYKPLELSDYVKSYLKKNGSHYTEDYPMYTRAGKVNEYCKSNPETQECYACTRILNEDERLKSINP